ncbi:MAG: hypothetical protein WCB78_18220, partial [Pseudolabrys sp.]
MAGLVPAIHVFSVAVLKTWIPDTTPGMAAAEARRTRNMMNVAERKQTNAPTEAQRWLASFESALQTNDVYAAAELFHADGLWR